jgi:hypothetical protein
MGDRVPFPGAGETTMSTSDTTELTHREQQLDLTLAALLSIYRTPKDARSIARKALADILGFAGEEAGDAT